MGCTHSKPFHDGHHPIPKPWQSKGNAGSLAASKAQNTLPNADGSLTPSMLQLNPTSPVSLLPGAFTSNPSPARVTAPTSPRTTPGEADEEKVIARLPQSWRDPPGSGTEPVRHQAVPRALIFHDGHRIHKSAVCSVLREALAASSGRPVEGPPSMPDHGDEDLEALAASSGRPVEDPPSMPDHGDEDLEATCNGYASATVNDELRFDMGAAPEPTFVRSAGSTKSTKSNESKKRRKKMAGKPRRPKALSANGLLSTTSTITEDFDLGDKIDAKSVASGNLTVDSWAAKFVADEHEITTFTAGSKKQPLYRNAKTPSIICHGTGQDCGFHSHFKLAEPVNKRKGQPIAAAADNFGFTKPPALISRPANKLSCHFDMPSFPHIFDQVVRLSNRSTQLNLRRTCRSARAIVDKCLSTHVIVVRPDGTFVQITSPQGRLPVMYEYDRRCSACYKSQDPMWSTVLPEFQESPSPCVIDIIGGGGPPLLTGQGRLVIPPGVNVVRYHLSPKTPPPRCESSSEHCEEGSQALAGWPPKAIHQAVVFITLLEKTQSWWFYFDRRATKCVFNIFYPRCQSDYKYFWWPRNTCSRSKLKEAVFVFTPTTKGNDKRRILTNVSLRRNLVPGVLAALARQMLMDDGVRYTLVDLYPIFETYVVKQASAQWTELANTDRPGFRRAIMLEALYTLIDDPDWAEESLKEFETPLGRHTFKKRIPGFVNVRHELKRRLDEIEFLTREEYRERVGEYAFRIQTEPDAARCV